MATQAEEDPLSYFINFCYKRIREEESGDPSVYDLITLPQHTILYEHHFPKHWLYYEGVRLFKKTGKDISDTFQIYSALVDGVESDDEVVAVFVTLMTDLPSSLKGQEGWSADPTAVPQSTSLLTAMSQLDFGDDSFRTCYLTKGTLSRFLQERARRSERGILQKFSKPRGRHCESIKFHWTPHIKRAFRRVNVHDYQHTKTGIGIHSRHQSFKNTVQDVHDAPLAPALYNQLVSFTNRLVSDYEATHEGTKVNHLLFFFQQKNGSPELIFLFCNACESSHFRGDDISKGVRPKQQQLNPLNEPPTTTGLQQKLDYVINKSARCSFTKRDALKQHARPRSATSREAVESFRNASVIDRYNFLEQAIAAGMYDSVMKSKNRKQAYILNKFETLVREVHLRESRELQKFAKMKERTFGNHCRPKTMGQLANNLLTKGGQLGDTETTTLVQVAKGAQHGAVLGAVVIIVLCCRNVKWAIVDDRNLSKVVTCQARQIWKSAQQDRKTQFTVIAHQKQIKPSEMTFTKHPKFAPRLADRVRNIQTIYDQELFHMVDKGSLFLSDRIPSTSRCSSVRVSTTPASKMSIENTIRKKQGAMNKRHAKIVVAIETENRFGSADRS